MIYNDKTTITAINIPVHDVQNLTFMSRILIKFKLNGNDNYKTKMIYKITIKQR